MAVIEKILNQRASGGTATTDASELVSGILANARLGTGIPVEKLADGSISDEELQHLDGLTNDIVTLLAGKSDISHTHTKGDIGLGNVDNTSDANKPVSTAQLAALNLKANLASPTFTGTVNGITKSMVGLPNVDNTSDANKPISSATLTALDGKVNVDGAKVLSDNNYTTTEKNKLAGVASGAQVNTVTSVASKTGVVTLTKADVGLGNVDNTSDTNKPVSTAQYNALNLKANLASPTFTGTVSGISKSMVGLGNVDNTSDANMPVSTAQLAALNLKANSANPTFTGTVSGVTKTHVGLPNVANVDTTNASNISSGTLNKSRIPTQFLKLEGSLSRMIGEDGFPPPTITADTTGTYVDYTVVGAGVGRQVKCNVRNPGVSNLIAIGECTGTDTVRVYFCTTSGSVDIEEKAIDIMIIANNT